MPRKHAARPAKKLKRSEWIEAISSRLKRAREDAGKTQKDMALALGIEISAYSKYENRSALPAYLVAPVCEILGMDSWFLLTGRFHETNRGKLPHPNERPFTEEIGARTLG